MTITPSAARRCAAAVLAATFILMARPPAADACSPPSPGIGRLLVPATGSTGVPQTAWVRLHYTEHNAKLPAGKLPRLVDAGGNTIPTDVDEVTNNHERIFVLRPKASMTAGAVITVKDWLGTTANFCSAFGGANMCIDAEVTAGSFTVGHDEDTQAPKFDGLTGFSTSWDSCDNSACCGPYAGYRVKLLWKGATDNLADMDVRYRVVLHTANGKATVGAWLKSAIGATAGAFLTATTNLGLLKDGAYQVCAVDLSGNETCGTGTQTWTAPPPPGQPDAGSTQVDGGADTGTGDTTPGDTDSADGLSGDGVDSDTTSDDGAEGDSAEGDGDAVPSSGADGVEGQPQTDTSDMGDGAPGDMGAVQADGSASGNDTTTGEQAKDGGCNAGRRDSSAWMALLLALVALGGRRRQTPSAIGR